MRPSLIKTTQTQKGYKMNIIIILAMAIAFVVALIFSTRLQTAVFQALQIAGVIAQGIWTRVAGVTPTVGNMFVTIFQTAWRVARIALIALIVIWAANLIVFLAIGFAVNAEWSGLFLGIFIPMFSICYILRCFPVIGKIARFQMVVSLIIIVLFLPFFATGVFSPNIKGSLDRWSQNQKQTLANKLDKSSLQSEPEVGVIATLPEETVVYNNKGQAIWKMPAGTKVMVMNLQGYPKSEEVGGMAMIMLENKYGDFVKGNKVFVLSNKIQM